jgi:DNA polymerase-3 subunit alpha
VGRKRPARFRKGGLGFYITGHLWRGTRAIKRFATCDTAGLQERSDKEEVKSCGIVAGLKELTTKRHRMAFVTLEDLNGFVEMVVFPEVYLASSELLRKSRCWSPAPSMSARKRSSMANEIVSLREVKERLTKRVHFRPLPLASTRSSCGR